MKTITGKMFCRLLEDKNWKLMRINGSHHIYSKTGFTARISVPIGLQRHLMKIAGIDESEL